MNEPSSFDGTSQTCPRFATLGYGDFFPRLGVRRTPGNDEEWSKAESDSRPMTNMTNETTRSHPGGLRRLLCKLAPGQDEPRAMQAVWNGKVIAESDDTVIVEGNHYFPIDGVDPQVLQPSSHHTVCPWKGIASYYDVVVDGELNRNAAWYYAKPSPAARAVIDRLAFWHGVKVRPAERGH